MLHEIDVKIIYFKAKYDYDCNNLWEQTEKIIGNYRDYFGFSISINDNNTFSYNEMDNDTIEIYNYGRNLIMILILVVNFRVKMGLTDLIKVEIILIN